MELETGRPSAIYEHDCDLNLLRSHEGASGGDDFLRHWISLAKILGQISDHIYRKRVKGSMQLFRTISQLDQALLAWSDSMPEGMKPELSILLDDGEPQTSYQQHIVAFLALQYYQVGTCLALALHKLRRRWLYSLHSLTILHAQAQVILFWASLIFPDRSWADELRKRQGNLMSSRRLIQSQSICVGATKSTINLLLEMEDRGVRSSIISAAHAFLAATVLALHPLKNPAKRIARSDMELLIVATEHAEGNFRRIGQNEGFIRIFSQTRDGVQCILSRQATTRKASGHFMPLPVSEVNKSPQVSTPSMNNGGGIPFAHGGLSEKFFGGMVLEDLWTMMGGDFLAIDAFNTNSSL
jgi:hypothetical protein